MAKLPTFERTRRRIVAAAELAVEVLALGVRRLPGDQRQVEPVGDPAELLEVLADDQHPVVGAVVLVEQELDEVVLGGVLAGQAELVAPLGDGVFHPARPGQAEPDLVALRLGDPALLLQDAPGDVELLGADQAEDVLLAVVLADEGGRQAEPAAGLDLGGDPEDRRGEQVDLVVDDQAPVALVEEGEVGEVAVLLGPVGDDLVGGQRDRGDRLASRRCRSRPSTRRGRSCRGSRAATARRRWCWWSERACSS